MADDAPVRFELGFAGSAEADPAANTRQVGPHARQPREEIFELRELDLQLGFVAARARRKDVENHFGAIHDSEAEAFLELHALHRRERFVEQHERCAGGGHLVLE